MDNLHVDKATGDIWTAAHPVKYKLMQSMGDPVNKLSPSQVSEHVSSKITCILVSGVYAQWL